MPPRRPSYDGTGLVNLVSELERRLVGSAPSPGLESPEVIPDAGGYLLVVFDGLGHRQLEAPEAHDLAASEVAVLTAGFPTTTTSSLATLATGLVPAAHGIIGHIMDLPGSDEVVNVLKWVTPSGAPVVADYARVLPSLTVWERLTAAGVEAVTVQPGPFTGSPLSQMLYRGCRFEPVWDYDELVDAAVSLARPGRLVVAYYAGVDVAAHLHGQHSDAYRSALSQAATLWTALAARLSPEVTMVGTADHGHVDYRTEDKLLIRDARYDRLRLFGDPRAVYATGPHELVEDLAEATGAEHVGREDLLALLGAGPHHPELAARLPTGALLAPPGRLLMAKPFDRRLIGYHGGLEAAEIEIPLLVGGRT